MYRISLPKLTTLPIGKYYTYNCSNYNDTHVLRLVSRFVSVGIANRILSFFESWEHIACEKLVYVCMYMYTQYSDSVNFQVMTITQRDQH